MKTVKILRYLILIALVVFAVSRLAPHLNDFYKIIELKNQINYFWLTLAVFSQFFQYFGDGWLSQILLGMVHLKFNIKDTFRIASLNVFAAHILPVGEVGGLATAYHFYSKLGVDAEKFIFLSVAWTLITQISLLALFLAPIFFIPNLPISINTSVIIISLLIAALVIASIYVSRHHLFNKIKKFLGKYEWAKPLFTFIHNRGLYKELFFKHPFQIILSLLACLLYYASNIATLAFSFLVFNTLPAISIIIFAYTASLIFSKITLAPAGIGATEATLILIFLEANYDPKITLAAVVIYRLISFWLPIPAGFFSFYSLKKEAERREKNKLTHQS